MFYFLANNGPQAGRKYELKSEKHILGRHPDCDIQIEVGAVSRNHCQVVREAGGYAIEDLGSRNGTFVNDDVNKIEGRRMLRLGDLVRVCEVTFTFQSDGPQPQATAGSTGSTAPGSLRTIDGAGLGAFLADDEAATPNSTIDRKSTRLNSSHLARSRMPSSA